jgi:zinc protease
MESNGGVGNALVNIERFKLGLDYYQRYADRVLKVTAGDVLEVGRKYLNPDALIITSAGVAE